MGIINFLKGVTRSNRVINLDSTLGNVLITGTSKEGKEVVLKNYAIDSVNKDIGVIIFRDQITGVSSYPTISPSNRLIYEVDCSENSTTEQIDVFAGMNDKEICNSIIKIFDLFNEIERTKKMSYINYISILRNLVRRSGKTVKLNNLADYPIEEVELLNMRYCTSVEQSQNDRFLTGIRSDIRELESYFFDFSQNMAGYVLSGNKSLEKIFNLKPIIEISLDFAGKPEESKVIISTVLDALNRANISVTGKNSINVIIDGAPNEVLIDSGLQNVIKSGRGYKVLYTVQDISNLVKDSNEWIDYVDSYFFFKQNSNQNKEFCSEFFGTYEKKKEQITKGTSKPTFWDRLNGTGTTSKQNSTTVTYEKERVYLPEVFSALPDNQAIYYSKNHNEHTRLTVY